MGLTRQACKNVSPVCKDFPNDSGERNWGEGFASFWDAGAGASTLETFEAGPWRERYPAIAQIWGRQWAQAIPFLAFPENLRGDFDTTNAFEALNSQLRPAVGARGHCPSNDAATKLFCLAQHVRSSGVIPP